MGAVNKAFEVILQYKGYFQRFAEAEAALLDAARLEGVIEQMQRDAPGIKVEYETAVAARDEAKRERDTKMAICKESIVNARKAVEKAEIARDKDIASVRAATAEALVVLARDVEVFKAKVAAEKAALGKEVAELTKERDALLRALSDLKRLAAR